MSTDYDPIRRDDDLQGDAPDEGYGDDVITDGTGDLAEAEPSGGESADPSR